MIFYCPAIYSIPLLPPPTIYVFSFISILNLENSLVWIPFYLLFFYWLYRVSQSGNQGLLNILYLCSAACSHFMGPRLPSAIRSSPASGSEQEKKNPRSIARICLLKLCPMDEFLPGPKKFRYSYKLNMEEERCSRRASYVSRRRG